MKKMGITAGIVVIVLGFAGYFGFQYMISQPMYQPGDVRKQIDSLVRSEIREKDGSTWEVEEGIRLHHFERGNGRNVLVIHGGPGFPVSEPFPGFRELENRFRFVYYDQRGCGKSTRPIQSFSSSNFYENGKILEKKLGLTAQLADIERIRRHLEEDRLILVGHSFGAFIASLYAAEFPERVEGMVLIAPADVLILPQESGGLYEEVGNLLPQHMQNDYQDYMKRYFDFSTVFEKSESDLVQLNAEFFRFYEAALKSSGISYTEANSGENGGWMVQAMYFSMGRKHDYRDALRRVSAPVLVIHGENDIQTEDVSKHYADLFPQSKFEIIRNASHFPFAEQPKSFSQTVSSFLNSL